MKYYIYILYSVSTNMFYVGYSSDPGIRLTKHNSTNSNTFTSKGRPWKLKAVFQAETKTHAISLERFIKKQKSRTLLENLCNDQFYPTGKLAQLVRVLEGEQVKSKVSNVSLEPFFLWYKVE